jgi:hypothetical protein
MIWGVHPGFLDSGTGFFPSRIPDAGVKKHPIPDPGSRSATLRVPIYPTDTNMNNYTGTLQTRWLLPTIFFFQGCNCPEVRCGEVRERISGGLPHPPHSRHLPGQAPAPVAHKGRRILGCKSSVSEGRFKCGYICLTRIWMHWSTFGPVPREVRLSCRFDFH